MQILSQIRLRFVPVLESLFTSKGLAATKEQIDAALAMIRPAQNPQFGDYQANFAMPLAKPLGLKPIEIAQRVVAEVELSGLCSDISIAGPGFINLKLADEFLCQQANQAFHDSIPIALDRAGEVQVDRLGISAPASIENVVVDFSSPNVAKPMHVGHIRSTVIGDSLAKVCRYLGHQVTTDNHLGDWGTQFGMIIYGFRHFGDPSAYQKTPVPELSRIYRYVRRLMDLLEKLRDSPKWEQALSTAKQRLDTCQAELDSVETAGDKAELKVARKNIADAQQQIKELEEMLSKAQLQLRLAAQDETLSRDLVQHADLHEAVLAETSKLHAGDPENVTLWKEILPHCHDEIDRVYRRLHVSFDHCFGESHYHDRLAPLVSLLQKQGLITVSDGARCIFLENFDAPMIVQKRDGAFLYATTDLATIQYRMEHWQPNRVLYVVDHRQSEHFQKLFAVAQRMGYQDVHLVHVSFGTVMGNDGKPFKTREGDTVGLEGLIDDAVTKALEVVAKLDDAKVGGPEFSAEQRREIAEVVGVGALKYGDLSQNRTSDYRFDFDQMVALDGNTATYLQYSFARANGIFARAERTPDSIRTADTSIQLTNEAERTLLLTLIRFQDTLEEVLVDYRPNLLCNYLFELTQEFFRFYNRPDCRVVGAEPALLASRLAICDLMARTIKTGLALLGIQVVAKM
ncbi:MAG: arginine--tRNA ligase [Planctomycetaceae bacterium]|nr:arginine--tRNA ligase [Planctomycetaceae bacterium]